MLDEVHTRDPSIEVYLNHLQDTSQCRGTRKACTTTHPLETLDDTQGNDLGHGNSVQDDEISAWTPVSSNVSEIGNPRVKILSPLVIGYGSPSTTECMNGFHI